MNCSFQHAVGFVISAQFRHDNGQGFISIDSIACSVNQFKLKFKLIFSTTVSYKYADLLIVYIFCLNVMLYT